jgi:addiction module HigA family antidote
MSDARRGADPRYPAHPGQVLREELAARRITQVEAARRIGVPPSQVAAVVRRRRPLGAALALRLERLLGVQAGFWLRLQIDWDLAEARRRVPVSELERIEPAAVPPADRARRARR